MQRLVYVVSALSAKGADQHIIGLRAQRGAEGRRSLPAHPPLGGSVSPTPAHAARGYPHLEGRASASDALLGGHRLSIESYRERHVGAEDRQGVDRAASDARQWRECVRHEVGGHGEGDSLRSRRSACGGGHGMTPLQLLSEALRHQRSGAAHGGAEAELGWLHLGRVDDERDIAWRSSLTPWRSRSGQNGTP